MVKMENDLRKEMEEKLAKKFGPNAKQAAVSKAMQDVIEGKTSKAAKKIEEK